MVAVDNVWRPQSHRQLEAEVDRRAAEIAREAVEQWNALAPGGRATLRVDADGQMMSNSLTEFEAWADLFKALCAAAGETRGPQDATALALRATAARYDEELRQVVTPDADSAMAYVHAHVTPGAS